MPKVSVIINCHNGAEYLRECMNSIMDQTFKDYEIVFWDNCSTDNSAIIAQSYKKVRYFIGDDFIPLGAARNKALKQANGEYVAYIDCDDYWEPDKLEQQVRELDIDKSVGLVLTNYRRRNMMTNKTIVVYKDTKKKIVGFTELIMRYHFCLSSFMIRKKAFEGLSHLFHDEFKYAEEFELFSRVAYRWKTVCLPDPLVTYRIHKNMNTRSLQQRKSAEYEMILFSLRDMAPNIDNEYPEAIKWICFVRDFNDAKTAILEGNNIKVRQLMKPYINYNIKAKCYYAVSFLPRDLSKKIATVFYEKKY